MALKYHNKIYEIHNRPSPTMQEDQHQNPKQKGTLEMPRHEIIPEPADEMNLDDQDRQQHDTEDDHDKILVGREGILLLFFLLIT